MKEEDGGQRVAEAVTRAAVAVGFHSNAVAAVRLVRLSCLASMSECIYKSCRSLPNPNPSTSGVARGTGKSGLNTIAPAIDMVVP